MFFKFESWLVVLQFMYLYQMLIARCYLKYIVFNVTKLHKKRIPLHLKKNAIIFYSESPDCCFRKSYLIICSAEDYCVDLAMILLNKASAEFPTV